MLDNGSQKPDFNAHFSNQYGESRWPVLLDALRLPTRHCALLNPFADHALFPLHFADLTPLRFKVAAFARPYDPLSPHSFLPPSKCARTNLSLYYLLDASSLLATEALDVRPTDRILDLCAAPGGKSLAIFYQLGPHGMLTSNDSSTARISQLRRVVDDYIPDGNNSSRIKVTCRNPLAWANSRTWGLFQRYDKILVDAPCSAERHLLRNEALMAQWTPGRRWKEAKRQIRLLIAALRMVKDGGRVVYCTCSIEEGENDGVVEKVMEKTRGGAQVVKLDDGWSSLGEKTKLGWMVLPDVGEGLTRGWGPLYISVLMRAGYVF